MNKATALLAATTILFAGTSGYLAWSLRAERARPIQQAALAPLTSQSEPLTQEAPVETTSPEGDAAAEPDALKVVKAGDAPTGTLPARVRNRTYKAAQLAYFRLRVEEEYPDLAAALKLQPDEATAFIELLARQRSRDAADSRKQESPKGVDPRDRQNEREMLARTEQAEFLGESRTAEWNRYLKTLGSRAEVRELRTTLAESDYPLRRDQYEPLVTTLADEQLRHTRDREQLRRGQRDPANPTHAEVIEYMGKRLELIEESLVRRSEAAAAVLDSEQLRRYRSMIEKERLRAQVEYDAFVTLNAEAARAK